MPQEFYVPYRHTGLPIPADKSDMSGYPILIPDNCPTCGCKIDVVDPGGEYPGSLQNTCTHLMYYPLLWEIRIKTGASVSSTPQRCKDCKTLNEYAVPNKPDGSYVCYNCR